MGVWDMFHIGHLNLLKAAKSLGDILIVGVNTDELVKEYKGYYPLLPWEDRAAIIESCRHVDMVISADSLKKDKILEKYNVDILVHGDDKKIKGQNYMIKKGRKVVYLPYTSGRSSTMLRNALNRYYRQQQELIAKNRDDKS